MPARLNFRSLGVNLLRVFDVVMAQRNLPRAAERLSLTQPTVINALKRLKGSAGEFNPQADAAGFRIAMADAVATTFVPALGEQIERTMGAREPARAVADNARPERDARTRRSRPGGRSFPGSGGGAVDRRRRRQLAPPPFAAKRRRVRDAPGPPAGQRQADAGRRLRRAPPARQLLRPRRLPFPMDALHVTMLWHMRHDRISSQPWLRARLIEAARADGRRKPGPRVHARIYTRRHA